MVSDPLFISLCTFTFLAIVEIAFTIQQITGKEPTQHKSLFISLRY